MSATAPSTLEGTWALDKLHSTASFAVKHMVVSTFRTSFKDIDATFVANGDEIALTGTVPAESIDIDQPDFRGHLMSAEFFDVANTPNIEFRSTSVRRAADDTVQVDGELTVKGITQPVTASGTLTGPVADVMGNDRVGVELEADVDRSHLRPQLERAAAQGRRGARQERHAGRPPRVRPPGGVGGMRILGISGSLRKDSHNTALLRAAAELLPPGVELELFDGLRDIPPYDADEDVPELHAPGVLALKDAIQRADAVLISTPEYNHSIPGVLKNALDWASRPVADNVLRGKPAAVIGASTGLFGAVWAQAEVRKVLGAIGAEVVDRELPVMQAHVQFDEYGNLQRRGPARASSPST